MSEIEFIEGAAHEKLHVRRGGRVMLCGHVVPLYIGLTPVSRDEAEGDPSCICKRCLRAALAPPSSSKTPAFSSNKQSNRDKGGT